VCSTCSTPRHRTDDDLLVAQRAAHRGVRGGEQVQPDGFVPALVQGAHQRFAEVPGAAGDQGPAHHDLRVTV